MVQNMSDIVDTFEGDIVASSSSLQQQEECQIQTASLAVALPVQLKYIK